MRRLILYCDGGSRGNPGPAAAGVVLACAKGPRLLEAGYVLGHLTNNQAEYRGLLLGVQAATRMGATDLQIYSDSELMVRQLNGTYRVKSPKLRPEYQAVIAELDKLSTWSAEHVLREGNRRADELVNLALDAGEDIVETAGPSPAEDGGPASSAAAQVQGPTVCARVVRPPAPAACPAPCQAGVVLEFGATVPAGLCMHAAESLIASALALRSGHGAGATVTCPWPGCCAAFEVSCSSADQASG